MLILFQKHMTSQRWLTGSASGPGGRICLYPPSRCRPTLSRRCGSSALPHPDEPHGISPGGTRWFWPLLLQKQTQKLRLMFNQRTLNWFIGLETRTIGVIWPITVSGKSFIFSVCRKQTWRVLEAELDVFPEATAVVIHDRLCVSKGLEKWIHLFRHNQMQSY